MIEFNFLKDKIDTKLFGIKETLINLIPDLILKDIDNNNKEYFGKLVDDFIEYKDCNLSFLFSKIEKPLTGKGTNYNDEMTSEEFYKARYLSMKTLIEKGFRQPNDFLPKNLNYHHCYVEQDNGFTISYDGSIYKCFGDANPPKNKIGQLLKNGEIKFLDKEYFKWYSYDYYENKECRECIFLPICMGSCAHRRLGLTPNKSSKCDKNLVLKNIERIVKEIYNLKK